MECARDNCSLQTAGKSKYCRTHKREARAAWKEMVAAKGAVDGEVFYH